MATPQLSPGVLIREVDLTVGRVDNAHGDRNLFCSCIPLEAYSS